MKCRENKKCCLVVMVIFFINLFVPGLRAEEPAKKKWKNIAELSFVSTNGNTQSSASSAKDTYTYQWTRTMLELIAGGVGAKTDGHTTAEEYYASEKVAYLISDRNYVFEKGRWDRNRFAGIQDRYDAGAGLGRQIIKTDKDNLNGELGGGYISEDRTVGPTNNFASGRAYTKYLHIFTPTATFSQDIEYLHNFDKGDDFRVNTETALISALSANLSLKVSYVWKHVGEPPVGFGRNDTTTSVSLLATY